MLARLPTRHLTLHLGGAVAAVAIACAAAALAPVALGTRWPLLLLVVPVVGLMGFVAGFVYQVGLWIRAPVPFRVPLTAGQQRALGAFPRSRVGNPNRAWEVMLRVLVDVLMFRPLLRATPSAPLCGPRLRDSARWLWLFAAVFHVSLAVVLLRHLRLLLTPVPRFVTLLDRVDFLSEATLPTVHLTTVSLPLALLFLLGRRLLVPRLRYISLAADYFPLLLLLAIAATGILMRHYSGADAASIKQLTVSLATLTPAWPAQPDALLLVHLLLVTLLFTYFPLSKLMHLPGALLSPTLTLANSNREVRHVNVRNPPVEVLHYSDYEAAFREQLVEAGLPLEEN